MPSDFADSSIPPVLSFDNVFFNVLFHGKKLSSHVWNLMKISKFVCVNLRLIK